MKNEEKQAEIAPILSPHDFASLNNGNLVCIKCHRPVLLSNTEDLKRLANEPCNGIDWLADAKPMLYNTEMVEAILRNEKKVTRRLMKPQPKFAQLYEYKGKMLYEGEERTWCYKNHVSPDAWNEIDWLAQFAPYQKGDLVYVRETFCKIPDDLYFGHSAGLCGDFLYKAGNNQETPRRWRPSLHMPRRAARIFLRITDVHVQRLQDMTKQDWLKEGLGLPCYHEFGGCSAFDKCNFLNSGSCKDKAISLWDSTVDSAELSIYGWHANPFVFVYDFEVCFVK